MYKLPDGTETSGVGWTLIDDMQYQLDRMTTEELEAIGVERIEIVSPTVMDPPTLDMGGTIEQIIRS